MTANKKMTCVALVAFGLLLLALLFIVSKGKKQQHLVWDQPASDIVTKWYICAPGCQAVTPQVVAKSQGKTTYRAALPANTKPPYTVKVCNPAGCSTASQ